MNREPADPTNLHTAGEVSQEAARLNVADDPAAVAAFRRAFNAGGPSGTADDAIRAGLDAALRESGATALLAEAEDLNALFALQWDRMGEATARWRAADPETRAMTLPDLGALLRWLMDDADQARVERDWLLAEADDGLRATFFATRAAEAAARSAGGEVAG